MVTLKTEKISMFANPKCLQIVSVVFWSGHETEATLPHGYWTIALKKHWKVEKRHWLLVWFQLFPIWYWKPIIQCIWF